MQELAFVDCFLLHLVKIRGRKKFKTEHPNMENVNLMFTVQTLQRVPSFPWVWLTKATLLCVYTTLCSIIPSFHFQQWMNLFGSFHFASLNTVQTKATNLSKIQTGEPIESISEQDFVHSVIYHPYSGEEESSSSSSSSSSLNEHGVAPRDSE